MTTIYLVRHAEAEGNLYRIAQGQNNSNLTDRGWRQVRALERRFAEIPVDAVYSSDLYRTCATASAIYKPKGLPLHRRKDLREVHVGIWEQHTWGDIYRWDSEQVKNFGHNIPYWQVEGAEAPETVLSRVRAAVLEIAAENQGKTVAVVSHGYALRLLLSYFQGYSLEETGKIPTGDNAAVSALEIEDGKVRVVFRDDNSHLRTPEFLAEEKDFARSSAMERGVRFEALRMDEHAEFVEQAVSEAWKELGRSQPFDRERLLTDAVQRTTLVAYLDEEPIGLVQTGPENGWISLIYTLPQYRCRGFGIQMIGQVVYLARPRGAQAVHIVIPADSAAMKFLKEYGFFCLRERQQEVM